MAQGHRRRLQALPLIVSFQQTGAALSDQLRGGLPLGRTKNAHPKLAFDWRGRGRITGVLTSVRQNPKQPRWLRGATIDLPVLSATATADHRQARIGLARQKFAGFGSFSSSAFYLEGAWLTMEFPPAGSARSGPDFSDHCHSLPAPLCRTEYEYEDRDGGCSNFASNDPRVRQGVCVGIRPNRALRRVIVNAFLVGAIAPSRRIGSGISGGSLKLLTG